MIMQVYSRGVYLKTRKCIIVVHHVTRIMKRKQGKISIDAARTVTEFSASLRFENSHGIATRRNFKSLHHAMILMAVL